MSDEMRRDRNLARVTGKWVRICTGFGGVSSLLALRGFLAEEGFILYDTRSQPTPSFKHVPGAETTAHDPQNALKDAPRDGTEVLLLIEMDQRLGGGKYWHVMHWVDDSSLGGEYGNWTDYWNNFDVKDPWDERPISYPYKNTLIGCQMVPETPCQPDEHMAADMLEKRARANILAQASREAEVTQNQGQFAQSSHASASNDSVLQAMREVRSRYELAQTPDKLWLVSTKTEAVIYRSISQESGENFIEAKAFAAGLRALADFTTPWPEAILGQFEDWGGTDEDMAKAAIRAWADRLARDD